MITSRNFSKLSVLLFALVLALAVLWTPRAQATIQIPRNLNKSDREETLRILGLGSSAKILSDPYPLGGYAGFEFGISVENLPTEDIGRLGASLATPQQEVAYPRFTIGKGLYNDIDFFVQFTPYTRQDELSYFGGIARWNFFQAKYLPASISALVHVSAGNISNLVTTRSYGADIIAGINVSNVGLFAGGGPLRANGTFIGGPSGVTDSNEVESESVGAFHTVIGANISILQYFLTFQMDRYTVPVFSGKLGVRF